MLIKVYKYGWEGGTVISETAVSKEGESAWDFFSPHKTRPEANMTKFKPSVNSSWYAYGLFFIYVYITLYFVYLELLQKSQCSCYSISCL